MAGIITKRIYKNVSSLTVETEIYTPENGEVLTITELGGNGAINPDTKVLIIWDYGSQNEVILFLTHNDSRQNPKYLRLEGDGSKKLAIVLINDKLTSEYMGGYWEGYN